MSNNSAQEIYKNQREILRSRVEKLRGSSKEAENIQDHLTALLPQRNQKLNKIQEELHDFVQNKLTDEGHTLLNNLAIEISTELRTIHDIEKFNELHKKTMVEGETNLSQGKKALYTRLLNQYNKLIEQNPGESSNILQKFIEGANEEIKNALSAVTVEGYKIPPLQELTNEENSIETFQKNLLFLRYVVQQQNVLNALGKAGELAVQKGLELVGNAIFTEAEKITSIITGDDKSFKAYLRPNLKKEDEFTMDDVDGFISHTDDKVDVKMQVKDKGGKVFERTFSVKNQRYLSHVKILSGNGYPILTMYPIFLKHYISLLQGIEVDKVIDNEALYSTIKTTIGVHALIGGVLARIGQSPSLVSTDTADYLIINEREGDNPGFKVFSMKKLCETLLSDESAQYIDLVPASDREAKKKEILKGLKGIRMEEISSQMLQRFSGLVVILHLANLRNSLNTTLDK